jgi:hypothetical protein
MKLQRNDLLSEIIEGPGHKDPASAQAAELLNHALRLEYSGVTHLPRLDGTVQDVYIRYCISVLTSDSTGHAVRLASTIRELGSIPCWTIWSPPDSGNLIRLFEIQLARERICHNLYDKAAKLLAGSPLAERCNALAQDEDRHIEMVERVLKALMEKEGLKPAPVQIPRERATGVVIVNTASTS